MAVDLSEIKKYKNIPKFLFIVREGFSKKDHFSSNLLLGEGM